MLNRGLKIIRVAFTSICWSLGLIICCYIGISLWAKDKIYDDATKIPFNKVGIVLGTSKYIPGGGINLYFKHRIDAAVSLFQQKKIQYLIVSGNREPNYNEPNVMEQELIKKGIPAHLIYKDYAGLRTLDSVLRAHEIFSQQKFTVISQKFHNERAVFIADHIGLNAVGFNAETPLYKSKQPYFREALARIKALWDIFYGTQPKLSGERIPIP